MIVTRASQFRHGVWSLLLLAATGLACGSSGTTVSGTGGGSGSGATAGDAGTTGGAGTTGSGGTTGSAGTTGGSGDAGTTGGPAGTSGNVGSGGSAGSTSGSAGMAGGAGAGAAGRGGTTGAGGRGGTTGAAGSSGTTGAAGTSGGRGGATGTGGAAGGAMPSAGCSATGTPPASGRFMIDVSGTQREYILKMPAGYDPRHAYRLIVAFHGAMYDAASVDAGGPPTAAGEGPYYGIEPRAGGSAIFVAGQALSGSWTDTSGRDTAYVNAMITRFKAELCVDQSRIFAVGFSMGAIMTIRLACSESAQFRAVAPMSGSLQGTCTDTMPLAYFGSHGTNDPTIAIAMGRMVRDSFRMRNHCTTTTVAGTQSGCVQYQGCDAGKPVTWCEFDGVHQPPPYSGEEIWRFFSQF